MKRAILGVVVLIASAGCSYSTMLTNQAGDIRRCSSAGWGVVGGTLAAAQHDSCVEDLKRLGYKEIPKSLLSKLAGIGTVDPRFARHFDGPEGRAAMGLPAAAVPITQGLTRPAW